MIREVRKILINKKTYSHYFNYSTIGKQNENKRSLQAVNYRMKFGILILTKNLTIFKSDKIKSFEKTRRVNECLKDTI